MLKGFSWVVVRSVVLFVFAEVESRKGAFVCDDFVMEVYFHGMEDVIIDRFIECG